MFPKDIWLQNPFFSKEDLSMNLSNVKVLRNQGSMECCPTVTPWGERNHWFSNLAAPWNHWRGGGLNTQLMPTGSGCPGMGMAWTSGFVLAPRWFLRAANLLTCSRGADVRPELSPLPLIISVDDPHTGCSQVCPASIRCLSRLQATHCRWWFVKPILITNKI